jgi:hypothetical protein
LAELLREALRGGDRRAARTLLRALDDLLGGSVSRPGGSGLDVNVSRDPDVAP